MDGFSLQTTLTISDWRAYTRALIVRTASRGRWASQLASCFLILLIGGAAIAYGSWVSVSFQPDQFMTGVVVAVLLLALNARLSRGRLEPSLEGYVLGASVIDVGVDGVRIRRSATETFTRWSLFQEVTATSEHIFIWVDRVAAKVLPVRDLPPGLSVEAAAAEIHRLAGTAGGPNPEQQPVAAEVAWDQPVSTQRSASMGSSLASIVRLYAFRSLGDPARIASESAILVVALSSIGLWALLDRWIQEGPVQFWPGGLTDVAWYVVAALVVAWAIARRTFPTAPFRSALWVVVSLSPLIICGFWIADYHLHRMASLAAIACTTVVSSVYATRALRTITGTPQYRAVFLGCCLAILIGMAGSQIYVGASLWIPAENPDHEASWGNQERLLFAQPARIEEAIAHVAPRVGIAPVTYMVGFAGVGEQRVFADEIGLASRVVGTRYGTATRTVLLLNDRRDLEGAPFATVSGLRITLHKLAAQMDLERDTLFLVISSHGSAEPSISVSNASLPLDQLTGEALASALKEAGIQRKVIVISACHAGAFIPPLKSDTSVILTAAAADRSSFGCSDDRDLTYFGEAFFRDALPHALTLQDAFERAKSAIASREKAEGVMPSNPQAFYGKAMLSPLAELDKSAAR